MKLNVTIIIFSCLLFLGGTIDLSNLDNYSNQYIPSYITRDNMPAANPTTDAGATLGRLLFYDKNLSYNNTISCGSCHIQQFAFGDTAVQSIGVKALSQKHSMRLVNIRFGQDSKVLWAKNVANLEAHMSLPIKADSQMGFSGIAGAPDFDSLITKLENISFYPDLFNLAFGSTQITELRIEGALSQFVRSIQSFDSKYDTGRAAVGSSFVDFPNFTAQENLGKSLFNDDILFDTIPDSFSNRIGGGLGCASCHRPPEYDIHPNSLNNGIVALPGGGSNSFVFRSPTMRDMLGPNGETNGPFMHDGGSYASPGDVEAMLDHYNEIIPVPNIDPRLAPNGFGQRLNLTIQEREALLAFFKTLTGKKLYTDPRWSDPFESGLNIVNLCEKLIGIASSNVTPLSVVLNWDSDPSVYKYEIRGKVVGGNNYAQLLIHDPAQSQKAVTGLQNSTSYHWQIRSVCEPSMSFYSEWSSMDTFKTGCREVSNHFANMIGSNSVRLNWTRVDGALGYEIRGRKIGNTNWVKLLAPGGNVEWKEIINLASGTSYEWQVRGVCFGTNYVASAWTGLDTFSTTSIISANKLDVSDAALIPKIKMNSGNIHIISTSNHQYGYSVFNMSGQLIQAGVFQESTEISIEQYHTGIYILQLNNIQNGIRHHRKILLN